MEWIGSGRVGSERKSITQSMTRNNAINHAITQSHNDAAQWNGTQSRTEMKRRRNHGITQWEWTDARQARRARDLTFDGTLHHIYDTLHYILFHITLHCIAYCIALHCIALHIAYCIASHRIASHRIASHRIALHRAKPYPSPSHLLLTAYYLLLTTYPSPSHLR